MNIFDTSFFMIFFPSLIAGTLGGIIGTGSSLLLLPFLSFMYGSLQSIPIMGIAAIFANIGRLLACWQEVDWRALLRYSFGSVLASALGAQILLAIPNGYAEMVLGSFFLILVPLRRLCQKLGKTVSLRSLPFFGFFIGLLTGLVQSTGSLSVMLFSFYGLSKGALLGTEAATSLLVYLSKISSFSLLGALSTESWLKGLWVGSALMFGAFIGKSFICRIDVFKLLALLDIFTFISGVIIFWQGYVLT